MASHLLNLYDFLGFRSHRNAHCYHQLTLQFWWISQILHIHLTKLYAAARLVRRSFLQWATSPLHKYNVWFKFPCLDALAIVILLCKITLFFYRSLSKYQRWVWTFLPFSYEIIVWEFIRNSRIFFENADEFVFEWFDSVRNKEKWSAVSNWK